jgi:hypothetical protein
VVDASTIIPSTDSGVRDIATGQGSEHDKPLEAELLQIGARRHHLI